MLGQPEGKPANVFAGFFGTGFWGYPSSWFFPASGSGIQCHARCRGRLQPALPPPPPPTPSPSLCLSVSVSPSLPTEVTLGLSPRSREGSVGLEPPDLTYSFFPLRFGCLRNVFLFSHRYFRLRLTPTCPLNLRLGFVAGFEPQFRSQMGKVPPGVQIAKPSQAKPNQTKPNQRRVVSPSRLTRHPRSCGRAFTLLRRRHHCRGCGRIFCDACAPPRGGLAAKFLIFMYSYISPFSPLSVNFK